MLKWYEKSGKNDDVIISSRLRLARNFNNYMFDKFLFIHKTRNLFLVILIII